MNRRDFTKTMLAWSAAAPAVITSQTSAQTATSSTEAFYHEPARQLPLRRFEVVVAGAGTAGVVAAIAAARQGARTLLVERKGYPGGTVTEGGTALHSYFNLWKAFPNVKKRQVVRGIPQEIIDRLARMGGTSGHAEMSAGYDYDSVCTAVDVELYKLAVWEMLEEAGVEVCVNTLLAGAIRDGARVKGVILESRAGREAIYAQSFIDCTGFGDLAALGGASFQEPNDYAVCNSIGLANVSLEKLHDFLKSRDAVEQLAVGQRSGREAQIVRIQGQPVAFAQEFREGLAANGTSMVTTTVHDNYFMFVKVNYKMRVSPTNRDELSKAELELRRRQFRTLELFRKFVPGCEKALIARTSPTLNIRRGRLIACDYDLTHEDVIEGRHFDDDTFVYGFHDSAPRLQIKNGGTYGIPYRALCVKGIENLYAAGMMITSDQRAHMSTRNTVSCMGQGQATGTAAALCARKRCGARDLKYAELRAALEKGGVYFET